MKGFIVDTAQQIIHNQSYVYLFGRAEDGESFITINAYQPYFFIQESDLKKAQKIESFEYDKTELKTFDGKKVVKIFIETPADVAKSRRLLEQEGIATYEADILFPRRFLIDHNIQATIDIKGDYEYQEGIRVYKEQELTPSDANIKLRVMSIDIETDPRAKRIYSIAIVCDDKETVLITTEKKLKHAESFSSEEAMLERFIHLIRDLDPDIITGWHVIDFDIAVIRKRCKKLSVPFVLGRTNKESRVIVKEGFFDSSKVTAEGRIIVDALDWIRGIVKLDSYKLENVAQHYLGEGKIHIENKAVDIERYLHEYPQKLVDYNLKDAQLVLRILEKSNVLSLYIHRSKLTGLMIDEVKGSIASLDSIYLKKLRKRGFVAPSTAYNVKEESITGGYVMESKPGLYENIMVFDFKSLYPSLMRTFNIDPLSFRKKGITAPNGATFAKEPGIMPEILEELMKVREEYTKKKDEVGRYAIKILMNSFFGVMASAQCRYYSLEMANAITSFAQFFIKKTADLIRREGYDVIYSDTDSCFVIGGKDAEKKGEALQRKLNKIIADSIKKEYGVESYLQLEFEKVYTKFLMPRVRSGEKGAKKRYTGLVKGKLEVIGMEAIRTDWTPLARKFQKELLMHIFSDKEPSIYIQGFVAELKTGKMDNLLTYKKSLRKKLEEYAVMTPHKKAALKLIDEQGKLNGTTIEYIITTEGPEPAGYLKHLVDYDHYVKKQLKPIADAILTFYKTDFDSILKNKNQTTLFGF